MSLAVTRRNQWGSPSCMCLCSAQTSVNVLTIKDRERGRRRERGRLQDWSSLSDERCRLSLMIGKKIPLSAIAFDPPRSFSFPNRTRTRPYSRFLFLAATSQHSRITAHFSCEGKDERPAGRRPCR